MKNNSTLAIFIDVIKIIAIRVFMAIIYVIFLFVKIIESVNPLKRGWINLALKTDTSQQNEKWDSYTQTNSIA